MLGRKKLTSLSEVGSSDELDTFVNLNANDDDGLFYIFTPDENGRSQLDAIVD